MMWPRYLSFRVFTTSRSFPFVNSQNKLLHIRKTIKRQSRSLNDTDLSTEIGSHEIKYEIPYLNPSSTLYTKKEKQHPVRALETRSDKIRFQTVPDWPRSQTRSRNSIDYVHFRIYFSDRGDQCRGKLTLSLIYARKKLPSLA